HHRYEGTTHMVFEPDDTLQHAGLVIFKDETHQYQLSRCNTGDCDRIVLRMVADNGTTELASADLCDGTPAIGLRIISHGRSYDFLFSTDGGRNWIPLMTSVDARHTSTAAAGGFTGTLVGPYASAI
ncbi:MAG: glycoside hydrolase family 43 protein, partial [Muribaculaceae bacterium]|nr:glycoside hydrolase family 43 protein [Muribaculaceae bacterium]